LTKADAKRKSRLDPTGLLSALGNGGPIVWISCLIMGFGNICAGQIIKGLIWLAIEAVFIYYMAFAPQGGLFWLSKLPSLGTEKDQEVYNEQLGIFEYVQGDRSQQILLFGVVAVFIIGAFLVMWRASVRSGYQALCVKRSGKKPLTFWGDIKELFDSNIHKLLMMIPFLGILVFTIVPLVYMICMAFTNYCDQGDQLLYFDWVGFDTFKQLFASTGALSRQFWSVLGWTLIWAFFATVLNFFFGTFMAMIINRPTTKLKGLWRTLFSLTIAIPQFVSLLIIKNMFQAEGIFNLMLRRWEFIGPQESLPFWSDPMWARVLVIILNLWVGIPYTIMQVTGILQNIPADLYEAAKIDGANVAQQFINITLPYMIFVMTPTIIGSFTGNINNFNVIYLLSGGGPTINAGDTAGKTDLLITWLYKLSVDQRNYNIAAVIGILTFVVLAIVSLVTYRSSGSYKDEEGFK
jgi:arabinogalactan oligomer/maltooligosaccharide transport system permease protein